MAATVYMNPPSDFLRSHSTPDMRRDEQEGAYSWSHPAYSYTLPVSDALPFESGYTPESQLYPQYAPSPSWEDIPLDPHAIYHMPYYTPAWPGTVDPESPYERDRVVLRQAWEQRIREQWLRRSGIQGAPTDPQYDRFIPELRAGEYASGVSHAVGSPLMGRSAYPGEAGEFGQVAYYAPPAINVHDTPSTSSLASGYSLHPPYQEPTAYSPTDTESSSNAYLYPKLSTSPATVLSTLDSDAAESPLSAHPTSPSGSALAERASSVESTSHSATGPIRRGNSASERGKNAGNIRVHRPAGVKWNQRTRCAYVNPVTGLQCRTSAGRGPDLERHLRTVHLREEARAVSDGLIPRDKAELLPPDWTMGDRLDFDCPHCAVRFTREDARDRHVKVQHPK